MQECLPSDYHARDFYEQQSQFVPRDLSPSFVAPDMGMSKNILMSLTMFAKGTAKRKHEHIANCHPSYVESCLVQLCRGKRWLDVVHRCQYFPEEACLVPMNQNNLDPRSLKDTDTSIQAGHRRDHESIPLFRETALGIICASNGICTDAGKQAILALLHQNPDQVIASQLIPGHTPLREAILNGCCTVEIFRILLKAASICRGANRAFHQKDQNGHTLMDHLITSVQLGSSPDSISVLTEFLRIKRNISSVKDNASPLIRLLTMGSAFNVTASPMKARKFSRKHKTDLNKDSLRLQRVLHATKIFLDDDPELLHKSSNVTNCTPLHVALRNYSIFTPLIQELLDRDLDNKMVRTRNCYGDLPIHVACSVGVTSDILALLSAKTATFDTAQNISGDAEHPLLWCCNKSGHTPVDLLWISHVEAGQGLYTARPFSPSHPSPIKQHCFKKDAYYRNLLKCSVNEVIRSSHYTSNKSDEDQRKEEAKAVFGCLLDRISLLIHASNSAPNSKSDVNHRKNTIHLGNLCTPYSARLPFPLLELFLWLRPEEVTEKDRHGFLPIHHALRYGATTLGHECSMSTIDDWKSFVFLLLDKSSQQCEVKSREGRLPLHYVFDHSSTGSRIFASTSQATATTSKALQSSRHSIIKKLVELYPESVDQKDPITRLYPFMMASSESMSLDTIFFLLRRSPSRCPSVGKANDI